MNKALFLLALACALAGIAQCAPVVGGYFPNWSGDFPCHALQVKNFNATPYTHIWYAFGSVQTGSWTPTVGSDLNPGGVLTELIALKQKLPQLNVLVSFGGGGQSNFYNSLAASSANRAKFLGNVIPWLRQHNLDGLDYDWEFPTGNDAKNYNLLLEDTRTAINQEAQSSGKPKLVLTIAAYGDKQDLNSWPIADMSKSLDWFNMMTYEEHGPWDNTTPTGINAPINSTDGYDLTGCVKGYLKLGVPASKLALGIPTFGHSWVLANPNQHGIGAPGKGPAAGGPCTQSPGYLAYWEVTTMISQGATVVWDDESQTPYLYHGSEWVSYDNPQSFAAKGKFAKAYDLRGIFTWDINEDDNNKLIVSAAAYL